MTDMQEKMEGRKKRLDVELRNVVDVWRSEEIRDLLTPHDATEITSKLLYMTEDVKNAESRFDGILKAQKIDNDNDLEPSPFLEQPTSNLDERTVTDLLNSFEFSPIEKEGLLKKIRDFPPGLLQFQPATVHVTNAVMTMQQGNGTTSAFGGGVGLGSTIETSQKSALKQIFRDFFYTDGSNSGQDAVSGHNSVVGNTATNGFAQPPSPIQRGQRLPNRHPLSRSGKQICLDYLHGKCNRGTICRYFHSEEEKSFDAKNRP